MSLCVYILYSKALDQHYVGMSIHSRIRHKQHLRGQSLWTSRTIDWVCISKKQVETLAEARALEKRIKACGAHRYLERQKASQSRLWRDRAERLPR